MNTTKRISELRAEMQEILKQKAQERKQYKERLQNVIPRLPKNYATLATFINPKITKEQVYNVRFGRKQDFEILELLEQIADDHEPEPEPEPTKKFVSSNETLQENLQSSQDFTTNLVSSLEPLQNNLQNHQNITTKIVENSNNLQNNLQENSTITTNLVENTTALQENLNNSQLSTKEFAIQKLMQNATNEQLTQICKHETEGQLQTEKELYSKKVSIYNNNINLNNLIEKKSKEKKQNSTKQTAKLFKEAFPNFVSFRSALPEWDELTCIHWYEQAEYWSEEGNKRKKDWIKTVKIWNKRNPFKALPTNQNQNATKFNEITSKILKLQNELDDLRKAWKANPQKRKWIEEQANAITKEINQLKHLQQKLTQNSISQLTNKFTNI